MLESRSRFVLVALMLVAIRAPAWPVSAQTSARYDGPIIDMHMHAANVRFGPDGTPRALGLRCFPGPCAFQPAAAASEEEVLRMTLAAMDRHRIVLGFLSGFDGSADTLASNTERVQAWVRAAPDRFITSAFVGHPGDPPVGVLRAAYANGNLRALGEIAAQYYGYRPDAPELAPYFALADQLDLPVHIHAAGFGARLPGFRPSAGHPLHLEDVLARHPDLRIFVENAGFPFADAWIAVSYQYPQLYAEVSTANWSMDRTAFYAHLRRLVDAGLSKRIMFGSDQMEWPETIALAIESIQSADFLTPEQKADIFYHNAARFLRLTDEQIARHHGR